MNYVSRKWLRWFQAALLLLDLSVILLFLYQWLVGPLPFESSSLSNVHSAHTVHTDHISMDQTFSVWSWTMVLGAVLAIIHAAYALTVVWWFDKKRTWLVHSASIFISGVMLVILSNTGGPLHEWYHILLVIFMFFSTMTGFLVAAIIFGMSFVTLIVMSLGSNHLGMDPSGHVVEMISVSLSGFSAGLGWFFFNKKYVYRGGTEAIQALNNLVNQERNTVNLILESIADGVMIINTNGTIQLMNGSAAKMLGWQKEEAHSLQYTALLQPAINTDNPQQQGGVATPKIKDEAIAITETLKTGTPQQGVSLIKTRDNRQIYLDIASSPIQQGQADQKLVGIIVVLRNVDKQKREEQQRTEFISTASHEMRTPVAAIEGYLALALNDKVSGIDQKARGYLEKAHESTQHLGKLFQDLLTSTRAEDGRLSNHPVTVEMGQFLEQMAESLRFTAEKKGLLMEFVIGTGTTQEQGSIMSGKVIKPLYYTHVDPERIREVVTNLFDNAVKYTGEGKISLGLTGNAEVVQMYVRDTGLGIPPDDIGHLFQKFYRVDNSATRTIGGTGLGLFICRKIIELYKGRIWVESQQGKGSTFYINLPRLTTQKATELQATEAGNQQSPLSTTNAT